VIATSFPSNPFIIPRQITYDTAEFDITEGD